MNKDDIKKALECCANPSLSYCSNCAYHNAIGCNEMLCIDAFTLITEQENEIEYIKKQHGNQVLENTRLYIEYDKLKDDYSKLQELFAQYQIASDKEIRAQIKQAKIDVLNELKNRLVVHHPSVISEIDELLKEYKK